MIQFKGLFHCFRFPPEIQKIAREKTLLVLGQRTRHQLKYSDTFFGILVTLIALPALVDITLQTTIMRKTITTSMMMHPTRDTRVTMDIVASIIDDLG